eukprot:403372776
MNNSLGSIDSKQKSAIQDSAYPPSKFGQMRRMSIKNIEKPEKSIDQQSKGKISRSMTLLGIDDEKDKVKVKEKPDKSKKQTKRRVRKSSDDEFEYIEDERVNIQQDVKGIIRINDPRMSRWDLYIITLAFYNCFSIPFQTAFNPDIMDSAYFLIFNTCIDFCFFLDIMLTFRTTYYDPVSGDEIYDKKSIARKYLLGRFIIDFLSTVPFDNIAKYAQAYKSYKVRQNYSKTQSQRRYQTCCVWFMIVKQDMQWIPPLDQNYTIQFFYTDSIFRQYWISVYHAVLMLTGNDVLPEGDFQIAFVALAIALGAIVNANIFGSMAIILTALNRKTNEFQNQIDIANTAMKNMNLPEDIQRKIISYLQYTQSTLAHQEELDKFFEILSPSLKNAVTRYIFSIVINQNEIFSSKESLVEFIVHKIILQMQLPEQIVIQQGEKADSFYFLAKGDCEIFVKDEKKRDKYVKTIHPGEYFGEIALITQQRRSATVVTKNYTTIGYITQESFTEMCYLYPDVFLKIKTNMQQYQDRYKVWQKVQLRKIDFLSQLSFETLEELSYLLNQEYQTGQTIFKTGTICDRFLILVEGEIDIFVQYRNVETTLDTLGITGSIVGSKSMLNKQKISFNVRANGDVTLLSISTENLELLKQNINDLDESIQKALDDIEKQGMPLLDYQKEYKKTGKIAPIEVLKNGVQRLVLLARYHRKKDAKLSGLMNHMVMKKLEEERKREKQRDALLNSIQPVLNQKIQKLLTDKIEKLTKAVDQQSIKLNQIAQCFQILKPKVVYQPQNSLDFLEELDIQQLSDKQIQMSGYHYINNQLYTNSIFESQRSNLNQINMNEKQIQDLKYESVFNTPELDQESSARLSKNSIISDE